MNTLKIFREQDVFPTNDTPLDVIFEDRKTGKGIIFDSNKKIALVGNRINSIFVLPGGGIDTLETVEEGIMRECLEEIGCSVKLETPVGIIEDFRNRDKKHCINYCYIGKVIGEKGEPKLTEDEKKNGMYVSWVNLTEAIKVLENEVKQLRNGEIHFYNTGFNILRDFTFLVNAKV